MRSVALKYLCSEITRGSAPTYAVGADSSALVIGQSCVRPDGSFVGGLARRHVGPVPSKGRLFGGEVLINSTGTGTLGRVGLVRALPAVDAPVFADGHVTLLRPDPRKADRRFLAYALGLPASRAYIEQALSVGATKQRELNVSALRAFKVAAPHVEWQRSAADFLDRECGQIDELVAAVVETVDVVTSYERRRQEHDLAHHKETWGARKLGWDVEVLAGFAFPSDGFRHSEVDAVRLLRGTNIAPGRLRWEDTVYWPCADSSSFSRFRLERGDLVVGMDRPWVEAGMRLARVTAQDLPSLLLQRVARLRPRTRATDLDYVEAWLDSEAFRAEAETAATGVSVPHISPGQLAAFRIAAAPSREQHRFVQARRGVRRQLESLRQEADALALGLMEYRASLIDGVVHGKLNFTKLSDSRMAESLAAVREGERPEVLSL